LEDDFEYVQRGGRGGGGRAAAAKINKKKG